MGAFECVTHTVALIRARTILKHPHMTLNEVCKVLIEACNFSAFDGSDYCRDAQVRCLTKQTRCSMVATDVVP